MADSIITPVAQSLAQAIAQHQAAPPHEQNLTRASGGAWLISGCVYVAIWSKVLLGTSFADLLSIFLQAPSATPASVWIPLAVLAALGAFGCLWLVVGLRGARVPRDVMRIFWSIAGVVLLVFLLAWGAYLPRDWGRWTMFANVVLQGFYTTTFISNVLVLALLLRGPGNDPGRDMVDQQKAHGAADFVRDDDLTKQMSGKGRSS